MFKKELKDSRIQLRVSCTEKLGIEQMCEKNNETITELIFRLLDKEYKEQNKEGI